MRIKTKRYLIIESLVDRDKVVEVEARLPEGGGRFVVVDVPDSPEHRCWYFNLIKATAKEREELKRRRLIKD